MSGQLHAPAALPPGKNPTACLNVLEKEKINLAATRIRKPDRVMELPINMETAVIRALRTRAERTHSITWSLCLASHSDCSVGIATRCRLEGPGMDFNEVKTKIPSLPVIEP